MQGTRELMDQPTDDSKSDRDGVRRLALCVDDFGLHAGVNRAVWRLAELGRLNAVSCMVGAPAWADAAASIGQLDHEKIDFGLHLDLTETPLDPRARWPLPRLIAASYARRLDSESLRTEIEAQLDAFERRSGQAPDYVDGHQHVHQLPVVRDLLLDALQRRYADRLPWLRSTVSGVAGVSWRGASKPKVIELLGAATLRRLAERRGHRLNHRLLGVHDFQVDAALYRELLHGWLQSARDGDLLMCHPSTSTDAHDPLLRSRTSELQVLGDDSFEPALARAGIRLAPISKTMAGATA